MLKLFPMIIYQQYFIYLYLSDLEMEEGAEILGKCNEHISFRKSPSVVPRWGKECLVPTA